MQSCQFFKIPDSSMAEQEAVNFKVGGSNPPRGAFKKTSLCEVVFLNISESE